MRINYRAGTFLVLPRIGGGATSYGAEGKASVEIHDLRPENLMNLG
jgi:hypothetical protein